ncbi:hypothetical protein G6F35_009595 [Rhizopus arrhizus]|nr:hypothetical protein G6F35_009595 [Rhizopus arrhizus]
MIATGEVLDLERMRADVARVLDCAPAEIGDDDNLIDLDLDSMRMLGLVLAWGNTGLPLEFSQLAEHTTLRQWWGVAGLWFAQRLAPDNPSFNTAHAVWIDGLLDVPAFVAAANQAAVEAEAFALRFAEGTDGQPLQWHDPAHVPLLSVRDLSGEADPVSEARALMQADRLSAVDPTRDRISQQVLFDLGGQRWAWYLRVHHLAADGYGMALFSDRVCALYSGRAGEPLPGLAGVLADDAAYRADARRGLAGQWWREQLQGAPAGVGLAGTEPASDDALRWVQPLDAAFREQLLQASARWLQPWPDVLAALSAEYLRRMSAADEVVVGVPFMGRLGNASARVPAMVMNVLPLRVAAGEGSVEAFSRALGRQLSQGRKHGRYRGEQLRRDLGLVGAQQRLHGDAGGAVHRAGRRSDAGLPWRWPACSGSGD